MVNTLTLLTIVLDTVSVIFAVVGVYLAAIRPRKFHKPSVEAGALSAVIGVFAIMVASLTISSVIKLLFLG